MIKIAIDLDNTIINYGDAFYTACSLEEIKLPRRLNKEEIKKFIQDSSEYNWPEDWIKIQGRVYGELILNIKSDPRFLEFIENKNIEIISHKSENSLCGRYNLRASSQEWIYQNNLNSLKVTYFETLEEKIEYINANEFDIVIDDLENVLLCLSKTIVKIHFTHMNSQFFSSNNWTDLYQLMKLVHIDSVKKVTHSTFLISDGNEKYIYKKFKDTDRLKREVSAVASQISSRCFIGHGENFILYEYIEDLEEVEFNSKFSISFKEFYKKLQSKSKDINFYATHATKSEADYLKNVKTRIEKISYRNLDKINEILDYVSKEINLSDEPLGLKVCFPDFFRSNFYYNDNQFIVFDFESFGVDDLARTYLNCIHHFGHSLNQDEIDELNHLFEDLKAEDTTFWTRVVKLFDIVALEWLLIAIAREENLPNVESLASIMLDNINKDKKTISWQSEIVRDINDKFRK